MQIRIKGCNHCKLDKRTCVYKIWLTSVLKEAGHGEIVLTHKCRSFVPLFEKGDKVIVWSYSFDSNGSDYGQWDISEEVDGEIIAISPNRIGYFIQVAEGTDLRGFDKKRIYSSYEEWNPRDTFRVDSPIGKGNVIFSKYDYIKLKTDEKETD